MKERDVHKLIEEQNPEEKRRAWEKLSKELNIEEVKPAPAVTKHKKPFQWFALAAVLVCIVTLSVVLPITLKPDDDRYGDGVILDYKIETWDQTFKEYSLSHGNEFLYLDWYDEAEEVVSEYGYVKENKDKIVFYSESLFDDDTGETVKIATTDKKTRVSIFEPYYINTQEFEVKGVTVKWTNINAMSTLATFEYNNRIYYLELDEYNNPQRMAEIIAELF